jgi:hypothetical protein
MYHDIFKILYRNVTIMSAYDHQKVPKIRTFFDLKADILHKFRYIKYKVKRYGKELRVTDGCLGTNWR